jgi:hypothetical protein
MLQIKHFIENIPAKYGPIILHDLKYFQGSLQFLNITHIMKPIHLLVYVN